MFVFWTTIALLACAATLAVIWPLLRPPARVSDSADDGRGDDEARRLAVYRDRRREIESERDAGRLDAVEAERTLDELAAEAAAQFGQSSAVAAPDRAAPARRPPLAAVIAVALFIPAGAALVYDRIGTPDAVGLDEHELRGEFSPGKLDDAIARLTARTAANPADGEGWAMLAEAQRMKGDLPAAARAYERANAVLPSPSARLLADHADVLVALAGGEFMPEALALLDRALAADPRDVKTLAMLGAARYRQGRLAEALALLRQLREVLPADSGQADAMAPVIARLEAELGQGAGAQDAGKPGAQAAGAAPAASASGRVIAGRIEIDPALAARLPPGTTLFIAARPAEGPRMPLAVRRLAPERFPVDFELGDGDLMTPGAAAWTQGAVVVEARLSRSGQALRASGDLYGTSRTVSGAARDLAIRIDQVVP